MSPKTRNSAFTLVEILLVLTIIGFLGAVIYSAFAQGVRIWKRAIQIPPELDLELFFERMTQDLRGAYSDATQPVIGTADSMSFFTQARPAETNTGAEFATINIPERVTYFLDRKQKTLNIARQDYRSVLYRSSDLRSNRKIVDNTVSYKMQYYYYDSKKGTPVWQSTWEDSCLPEMVKATIEFQSRKRIENISRSIPIPSGGCS